MSDMEILFVTHKFPPATGGMEKQSFELINEMSQLTKVHCIVYDNKESRVNFFRKLNSRIRQIIKDNPKISIIHFNDGLLGAFSMFHWGYKHLKRSVTFHGLDVVFPGILYQKFIFPRFNRFDLIFAVSRATANACLERGIMADRMAVVNNGVDMATKRNTSRMQVDEILSQRYQVDICNKKVMVAIGRPVKRKGFSWFIKNVMPFLHQDLVLLLIGPVQEKRGSANHFYKFLPFFIKSRIELFLGAPNDEINLTKLLSGANKNSRVMRLGKLPRHEINAILDVADAFIMPNIEVSGDMEGFGLVCLEACMHGTKVFAAASGGITDAITHQANGILLPPGHIATWVYQLNQLVESADGHLSSEDIISFTSGRFSWRKMAEQYFLHFSNLTPAEN